jgi:hypothetical protein
MSSPPDACFSKRYESADPAKQISPDEKKEARMAAGFF